MTLHFPRTEYDRRIALTLARLREAELTGMLVFRQESMYWLTRYDTAGYSQFQYLQLGVNGRLVLLTRSSDICRAHATSIIPDIHLWRDTQGVDPARYCGPSWATRSGPARGSGWNMHRRH